MLLLSSLLVPSGQIVPDQITPLISVLVISAPVKSANVKSASVRLAFVKLALIQIEFLIGALVIFGSSVVKEVTADCEPNEIGLSDLVKGVKRFLSCSSPLMSEWL